LEIRKHFDFEYQKLLNEKNVKNIKNIFFLSISFLIKKKFILSKNQLEIAQNENQNEKIKSSELIRENNDLKVKIF
jgi:hypothetical protein